MYFNIMYGTHITENGAYYGYIAANEELSAIEWNCREDAEEVCREMQEKTGYHYWVEEAG